MASGGPVIVLDDPELQAMADLGELGPDPSTHPLVAGRIKGNRSARNSASESAAAVNVTRITGKNARNSRGVAKSKGGKGAWGRHTADMDIPALDKGDPNYDSDDEITRGVEPVSSVTDITFQAFRDKVDGVLHEYVENGDVNSVADCLNKLYLQHNLAPHLPRFVQLAVGLAMDKSGSQRELVSVMLSDLTVARLLTPQQLETGFKTIILGARDTCLDVPQAPEMIGNFLARAVADNCVSLEFIENFDGCNMTSESRAALQRASVMLKRGVFRLDNVWGFGGSNQPVRKLIEEMRMILREFLSSSESDEAVRCLQSLQVPHFHHEFVYEAIQLLLDDERKETAERLVKLLDYMTTMNLLTPDQVLTGFSRVTADLDDLEIDVPHVAPIFAAFVELCEKASVLQEGAVSVPPVALERGRKRMASESSR